MLVAELRSVHRRDDDYSSAGKPVCDWDDSDAREVLVDALARDGYASHFLRAVPDLFELARVLGHSHVRITELYTHLLPGHLERSRNAVNLPAVPENSPERGQSVDA